MKKYYPIIIVLVILAIIIMKGIFLGAKINIGRSIEYQIAPLSNGGLYPINVSAFGKLSLTKNQPKDMSQIIAINLIDGGKVLMREGIISKDGTIVMPTTSFLDVISFDEEKLVAKNNIWTVTLQKNSVTFVDKQGDVAELKSGFVGKYEY